MSGLLLLVLWLVCGALAYGRAYADLSRYDSNASARSLAAIVGLLGPLGMFATFMATREERCGFRFRRPPGVPLALLAALFAVPAFAQDPQTVPPVAPAEALPSPAPPKPKLWSASFEAGPSTVSTPEDLKGYASVRATLTGEPWPGWRVFAQGRADRTTDGSAQTIESFSSFRSAEALGGALYRIGNTPVSVIGVGAMSWSLEEGARFTITDPNLWSFGGGLCLEKWNWWPEGGLACVGVGRWAGRDGVRFDFTYPVKGGVSLVVGTDVSFKKLPDVLRALPGAIAVVTDPTPEQLAGAGQRLPVAVKVGVLVPLKKLGF